MKGIFIYLLIILIINITTSSDKLLLADEFPYIGIVTASKLTCRKEPNIKSEKLMSYNFSNPIILINKSQTKETIDGIEEYWYQDKTTNGWMFGGHLLLTKFNNNSFLKFKPERIWCNVSCGGFSCFYDFEPFILGDYFIAYIYLNDYPQENDPFAGIMIGSYIREVNNIFFKNIKFIGGYYENGEWIKDIEKSNSEYTFFKKFEMSFRKVKDQEGDYYLSQNESEIKDRKEVRMKCKGGKSTEEIWYQPYTFEKIALDDFKNIIPFKKFKIK